MIPPLSEIKRKREELGLTQAELAEASRVSQSLIAKIENGKTDPVYSKLKNIFLSLEKLERGKRKIAEDVMSETVHYATPKAKMRDIFKMMKKENISQVPVIERGRCLGSITERTILSKLSEGMEPEEMMERSASEFMEAPFPMLEADSVIKSVSNLLSVYSAVLVTKNGKIEGIITRADLF